MTEERGSRKYSLLIGGISAYWSVTEYLCDQALATLLRIDPDLSRSITMPVADFAVRLEILRSVARGIPRDPRRARGCV